MPINYHNRKFAGVSNSPNGQVTGDTVFEYQQEGNILKATYRGGGIKSGYMLGKVNPDGTLYFLYHHLDENQNLRSGCCFSRPKVLEDGRIRLYENWEWTHGGAGEGESIVEEIAS